jgi:calcineurin-like phosphoesterase
VKILFIGDIYAHAGRRIVADHLADIRKTQNIDLVIANGENSAGGFGITPQVADELINLGIDVITGGNHSFDKKEIYDYPLTTPSRKPMNSSPVSIQTPVSASWISTPKPPAKKSPWAGT